MSKAKTGMLRALLLCTTLLSLHISTCAALETYTNAACRAVTSQMGACASRWDSIRVQCKSSVTTNTVWPGPCECAYYANDLPCFDEQEFCADQVWTQVPQWFRNGVTSCIMKDASYTIRAQLGKEDGRFGNPFTVAGLAGNATRTASNAATSTPARAGGSLPSATATDTSISEPGFSVGAKAGFGVGIGAAVILMIVMAVMIVRNRRKGMPWKDIEAKRNSISELHEHHGHVHQISSTTIYPKNEMMGSLAPQHELSSTTYVVELPDKNSGRQSRG